ncbi:MAG: 4'-phosphopantetheinyl transferase family protein, partial [Pseudomonas sp.]
ASVPAVGADRAPPGPAGVVGSITHGGGWAAALVARREDWRGLGLDMEQLLAPARAERLAGEILTPVELRRLPALDAEQRARLVTLTFSLKESLFKALYPLVQKRFYFQDAELLEWREDGSARLRLLSALSADWPSGAELDGQFALFDGRLLSLVGVPPQKR